MEYQLTIGEACEKHDVIRSTLTLWVKNGKVVSEKRMDGRKPVYFINEESLLEQMARSKGRTNKQNEQLEQPPAPEGSREQKPQSESQPGPVEPLQDATEPDAKRNSNPRKHTRSNVLITRAKNAMRSLDQEELIRVNSWLAKRILDKSPATQTQSRPPW